MNVHRQSNELNGRPNGWSIVLAVLAVIVSSAIAFCCTCYPLGHDAFMAGINVNTTPDEIEQSNRQLNFAFRAGIVAAVFVGLFVFVCFRRAWSKS